MFRYSAAQNPAAAAAAAAAAATSSSSSSSSNAGGTAAAAAAPAPAEPAMTDAEILKYKALDQNPYLLQQYKELVKDTQAISDDDFWQAAAKADMEYIVCLFFSLS
jgi:hypothetical protein